MTTRGVPAAAAEARPLHRVECACTWVGYRRRPYSRPCPSCRAPAATLRPVWLAGCAPRIVLMHYSPTADTLQGEPRKLLPLLGCDRLAGPIAAHEPDLVVHGHAHHGTLRGQIGRTPVFNVSVAGFHELELAA